MSSARRTFSLRPRRLLAGAIALGMLTCGLATAAPDSASWYAEDEVYYKIFVRSYADSNGDRIGDLRGIEQQIPYLEKLGVTTLLLTPIVPSPFYHNYFATRFDAVDPAYGTMDDFRRLARALHRRHMRLILDCLLYTSPSPRD